MPLVNDVHSRHNPTRVRAVVRVRSIAEVAREVKRAAAAGETIVIAGGRHAMGGQQFADRALLLDMAALDRVIGLTRTAGW